MLICGYCTVSCIDRIDQSKKGGRQISLRLHPNSELLSELKVLQIKFLDNQGEFMGHLSRSYGTMLIFAFPAPFARPNAVLQDIMPGRWWLAFTQGVGAAVSGS